MYDVVHGLPAVCLLCSDEETKLAPFVMDMTLASEIGSRLWAFKLLTALPAAERRFVMGRMRMSMQIRSGNMPVFSVTYFAPGIFEELPGMGIRVQKQVDSFQTWSSLGTISFVREGDR